MLLKKNMNENLKLRENIKIKPRIFMFYLTYTIFLLRQMFDAVNVIGNILTYINKVSFILLLINGVICLKTIIKNEKNIKKSIILFIVLAIIFISGIVSKDRMIIYLTLFIITFYEIEFDKFIKYDIKLRLISMAVVIICFLLHLTDVYILTDRGNRYSMGFTHPNAFAAYVATVVFEYIYLRWQKLNIKDMIVVFISILLVKIITNSRTVIIMLSLLLLYIVFYKIYMIIKNKTNDKTLIHSKLLNIKTKVKKIFLIFIENIFIICSILTFLITLLYSQGNEFAIKVDKYTSRRVCYTLEFFNNYDIKLFGNYVEVATPKEQQDLGASSVVLDNGYALVLLRYGALVFLIMCVAFNRYLKYYFGKKNNVIFAIMLIFLLAGLMEKSFYFIYFNVFLLCFTNIIWNKNKDKDEEKEGQVKI